MKAVAIKKSSREMAVGEARDGECSMAISGPDRHKEAVPVPRVPPAWLAACPLVIVAPWVQTARHVRTVVVDPRPPAESALPRRDYFQVRVLAAWPLSRVHEQT
jgi:hypothetical protein